MILPRRRKVIAMLVLAAVCYMGAWKFLKVVPTYHSGLLSKLVNQSRSVPKAVLHGPLCLHVDPFVRKDEFSAAKDDERITRVCPEEYKAQSAWNVNYNIERWYRYYAETHPTVSLNQKSSFLERFVSYYFPSEGIAAPKARIPKLFHFIWNDEIIPSEFVGNLKSFRTTHPDWTIHFWTLPAGRKFIVKHEPRILPIFDQLGNVFKADALRYVLIYHMGGAYFDIDSRVIKQIGELAENFECILGPEPMENPVTILGVSSLLANSGMLCKERHPFFRFLIDFIPVHGKKDPGPLFITKCFRLFLDQQLHHSTAVNESFEVKIVPHDYFEYIVLKGYGVDKNMVKLCVIYKPFVEKYLQECRQVYNNLSTDEQLYTKCERTYGDILQTVPRDAKKKEERKKMEFDACVEWIYHGEENRPPSKNRFIEHVHYGTHRKEVFQKLEFKEANNMSKVIPDIYMHT